MLQLFFYDFDSMATVFIIFYYAYDSHLLR